MALLEGESLLNDAAGIVVFRLAVAATITGAFSITEATTSFLVLAIGGVLVGGVVGHLCIVALRLLQRVRELEIGIVTTLLMPWVAYISAERVPRVGGNRDCDGRICFWVGANESSVQNGRQTGTAVWQIMVYILEAFVFISLACRSAAFWNALVARAIWRRRSESQCWLW